jgi:hypothetical protein
MSEFILNGLDYVRKENFLARTHRPQAGPASNHRNTYIEQRQTEKIKTEKRDVDRIRFTKV